MSTSFTLVALLFIDAGRRAEFERFEASASEIMKRYGGRIERRIAVETAGDSSRPDEVHVVTFPDRESFTRYRADPALEGLRELRAAAVRQTVIWEGIDVCPF